MALPGVWFVESGVVWHDPSAIQRAVWKGTLIIAVSVAFMLFSLYSIAVRGGWLARYRMLAVLGGWVILLMVQMAYVASSSTIVYGVYYNATSNSYIYYTAPNPAAVPVVGVIFVTAVVAIASFLIAYVRDQAVRMGRRRYAQL